MTFTMEAIGEVQSCFTEKFGTPRQPQLVNSQVAKIYIFEKYQPEISLQGLEKFSHIWILFYFHLNQSARFHAKVHPPRLGGEAMGLFATRTPHRPNPIGLSLVEISSVEKDGVWVRGVDIVQGTPVLDIKPYLPFIESRPEANSGWVETSVEQIEIQWGLSAHESFLKWARQWLKTHTQYNEEQQLVRLVEDLIQQDPRPVVYKGYEGEESPYRNTHALIVYNCDIHFRFVNKNVVEIFDCREIIK